MPVDPVQDVPKVILLQSLGRQVLARREVRELRALALDRSDTYDALADKQEADFAELISSEGGYLTSSVNVPMSGQKKVNPRPNNTAAITLGSSSNSERNPNTPTPTPSTPKPTTQQQRRATEVIVLPNDEEVERYLDDPCASTSRTVRKTAETNRNKKHPFDTVDYSKPFNPKPVVDASSGLQAFLRADKNWW